MKWLGTVFLLVSTPLFGAIYYVDGNCPSAGNGTSTTCGTNGPKTDIDSGISLMSAGDTLNIRGVHTAHDGETQNFDGRYFGDWFRLLGKSGTSTAPFFVQPNGYTGPGTGEAVFIDGSKEPTAGWTQCSDCSTGTCANVYNVGNVCSQTWWASGESGATSLAIQAQQADGSVTFKVSGVDQLTNNHTGYVGSRCSGETWHVCYTSTDCRSGETCTASASEIDSASVNGKLFVRWGTSLPAKSRILYDNNGNGFVIDNSSYVTIQGFTIRAHRTAGVAVSDEHGACSHPVITDNRIFYDTDTYSHGSDYGIVVYGVDVGTVSNNEIGWTGSENIHTRAAANGSALLIQGNWVHDSGDKNVAGPYTDGTPAGMILGDDNTGNGNYSGSVLEDNLVDRPNGFGVILENKSNGWIVRNNVFRESVQRACLKWDGINTSVNDTQVYNNLFVRCGTNPTNPSPGIDVFTATGKSIQNNKVYNNTFVNCYSGAVTLNGSGNVSGNEFKNNIMYDAGSKTMMTWDAPDTFANNLAYSATLPSSSTLVHFNGTNYTCSGLTTLDSVSKCNTPTFVNTGADDYHIQSGSPARDAGTSTGMPSGKTTDIANHIALNHGLPDYSDSQSMYNNTWDMGCDEYVVNGSGTCGDGHCHR